MNLNKYIGIKFQNKGRSLDSVDCWGLVRQFYANEKHIELPLLDSYSTTKDADCIQKIVSSEKHNWKRVETPTEGDVVVIAIAGKETHVGIYIEYDAMLHAFAGTDSCLVSLKAARWKSRIRGYFRYV